MGMRAEPDLGRHNTPVVANAGATMDASSRLLRELPARLAKEPAG
jgi:hypothetical protein